MKIKDITISIFAIIGFVTILSSFNIQFQETDSTSESHIWEMHSTSENDESFVYAINKKTGEVRQYDTEEYKSRLAESKNCLFSDHFFSDISPSRRVIVQTFIC